MKKLCVLVISIAGVLCCLPSFAQVKSLAMNDSAQVKYLDQLKTLQKSILYNIDSSGIFEEIQEIRNSLKEKMSSRKFTYQVELNNHFYKGDTSFFYPEDRLFTNMRFGVEAELFGIPLRAMGNGVLINGKFNKNFSTVGFSLDVEKIYIEHYKKVTGLQERANQKEFEKRIGITDENKKALINEAQYKAFHSLVTHPKYIAIKSELLHRKDSLSQNVSKDSSWQSAIALIDSIELTYKEKWDSRNDYFEERKEFEAKVERYKKKVNRLSNPNNLRSYLASEGKKNLKLKDKLFLSTQNLNLGKTVIDDNEFTLRRFPLNGFNYQYKWNGIQSGVAIGNHQLALYGSFLTDANSLLNFNNQNRIFFAYAGYSKNDLTTYQVSILTSNSSANSDTLTIFPKGNRVFSLSAEQSISDNLFLDANLAYSNQDFTNNLESWRVDSDNSSDNVALSLKTGFYSKRKNSKVSFGYFKVGSQFYTIGNPFLLKNRNGIEINSDTKILNNRLSLKAGVKYNFSNQSPDFNSVQFSNWQIIGEGTLRIKKKHSLTLRVMPNTNIRRLIKDQPVQRIVNNLYSFQGSFSSTFLKKELLSVFQISNFSNNFTYIDTTLQSNITHLYVNESLVIEKNKSLNLTAMVISPDYFQNSVSDYLFQLDVRTKFKNVNLSVGGQLLEQRWDGKMKAGWISNIQIPFSNWGSFGFNLNYRRTLEGLEKKNEFVGSTIFRTNI